MKIAVIGDIHGEINCLEYALIDVNKKHADIIFSTGDLVDTQENAKEIISICKENKIISVKGNHDEMTSKGDKCDKESRIYLANLPLSFNFSLFDYNIQIIHGSLNKNTEYMFEDSKLTLDYLNNADKNSILICGHTHIPYIKEKNSAFVMNPGSVSRPKLPETKPSYIFIEITAENFRYETIIL